MARRKPRDYANLSQVRQAALQWRASARRRAQPAPAVWRSISASPPGVCFDPVAASRRSIQACAPRKCVLAGRSRHLVLLAAIPRCCTGAAPDVLALGSASQRLRPSPASYFGRGQVESAAARAAAVQCQRVVVNAQLSGVLCMISQRMRASGDQGQPPAAADRFLMHCCSGRPPPTRTALATQTASPLGCRPARPPACAPPARAAGVQQRNLERALGRPVLDRVGLIIEIFSQRARTREVRGGQPSAGRGAPAARARVVCWGRLAPLPAHSHPRLPSPHALLPRGGGTQARLQVELASLEYRASRLVRSVAWWWVRCRRAGAVRPPAGLTY